MNSTFNKDCSYYPFPNPPSCLPFNLNVPKYAEYDKVGYARGHLMPFADWKNVNPKSTGKLLNLFINLAPQIGNNFNSYPWGGVENMVRSRFVNQNGSLLRNGIVVTGVCDGNKSISQPGITVPSCYWKLICYADSGQTFAYGYYGSNKDYVNESDRREVLTMRTLDDMLKYPEFKSLLHMISNDQTINWENLWTLFLVDQRDAGVTADECARSQKIPPNDIPSKICGKRKKSGKKELLFQIFVLIANALLVMMIHVHLIWHVFKIVMKILNVYLFVIQKTLLMGLPNFFYTLEVT